MRPAARPSWEFRSDVGFPTHAALFVRDALRLDTSADDAAPPRLTAAVPDRSGRLADAARSGALSAWLGVWHTLIDRPDAPFVALETLQRAPFALEVWDEAIRWANAARQPLGRTDPASPIPWATVDQTVAAVARDLGIEKNRLTGRAEFLMVRGAWWRVARPGVVLASLEAAEDPAMAQSMLRAAFVSGLEA